MRILKKFDSKEEATERTNREQEKIRLVRLYFCINILYMLYMSDLDKTHYIYIYVYIYSIYIVYIYIYIYIYIQKCSFLSNLCDLFYFFFFSFPISVELSSL